MKIRTIFFMLSSVITLMVALFYVRLNTPARMAEVSGVAPVSDASGTGDEVQPERVVGQYEPAESGATRSSGEELSMSDLPAGKLRTALSAMSEERRDEVLRRIAELDIPDNDYASLSVHPSGVLYYVCDFGGAMPLAGHDHSAVDSFSSEQSGVEASLSFAGPVPISSPPLFHSRPGSTNVLFLDFNGHVVTNTAWNSEPTYGLQPSWDCRPYSLNADETTFSVAEQQAIQTIWERVAEDYAPFDIDVTTEQPATWNRHTGHVLITPETDKNGVECPHFGAGGVAYVDVFGEGVYSYDAVGECYSPAWVLNYEMNGYAEYEAEAASHEMGHNLALSHDGTVKEPYYGGHGNGSISWGPIMGTGYDRNVSQWSKGDYRQANNHQDDLAIIAARMGYRPDDFGNDILSADPLSLDLTGSMSCAGVVEMTADADCFYFSCSSGTVEIAVTPYRDNASTTWGGNLDIVLELYDQSGVLLTTNNPTLETTATLSVPVDSGVYYIKISSTGVGNPFSNPSPSGYNQYGSIGQYTLTGVVPLGPDFDGDGLPNAWELEFFGDPTNASALIDTDGDGLDDLSEYISGTDPTNALSVFRIVDFFPAVTGAVPNVIVWDPVSEGREYGVEWTDDLDDVAFSNISGFMAYPANSYTDTVERAGAGQFYRVNVQMAP